MWRRITIQILVTAGLLLPVIVLQAATEGRILSGDSVDPAAGEQISGEIAVFQSVAQGIKLSLAACTDRPDCEPMLSENELAQLIQTLDKRIERLNAADQSATDAPNVDRYIDEYRKTRQQYALYMQELRDIKRDIKAFAEEEVPAKTPADDKQAPPPKPEQSARKSRQPAPKAEPKFKNEEFSVDSFEDVDEPIRSE